MLGKLTDKPQGYVILCVPQCWSYKCVPAHPVSSSREQTQVLVPMWQVLYWLIDPPALALKAPLLKVNQAKRSVLWESIEEPVGAEDASVNDVKEAGITEKQMGPGLHGRNRWERTFKGRSRQEPRVTRNGLSQQGRGNWAANSTSVACNNKSSEMDSKV